MPVYRTGPDVSLDDLVAHLEWVGEPIVQIERVDIRPATTAESEWVVVTHPIPPRAGRRLTVALGQTETRS